MGLDNIPLKYPCVSRNTAVRNADDQIDCTATASAGGCPWQNATDRPEHGRVLGMLATSCWYRGKYGEYLLEVLDLSEEVTFFGDNEDGTSKSALSCKDTSKAISSALDTLSDSKLAQRLTQLGEEASPEHIKKFREDATYAAWWLNWVAREGGGSTCWY